MFTDNDIGLVNNSKGLEQCWKSDVDSTLGWQRQFSTGIQRNFNVEKDDVDSTLKNRCQFNVETPPLILRWNYNVKKTFKIKHFSTLIQHRA